MEYPNCWYKPLVEHVILEDIKLGKVCKKLGQVFHSHDCDHHLCEKVSKGEREARRLAIIQQINIEKARVPAMRRLAEGSVLIELPPPPAKLLSESVTLESVRTEIADRRDYGVPGALDQRRWHDMLTVLLYQYQSRYLDQPGRTHSCLDQERLDALITTLHISASGWANELPTVHLLDQHTNDNDVLDLIEMALFHPEHTRLWTAIPNLTPAELAAQKERVEFDKAMHCHRAATWRASHGEEADIADERFPHNPHCSCRLCDSVPIFTPASLRARSR